MALNISSFISNIRYLVTKRAGYGFMDVTTFELVGVAGSLGDITLSQMHL